MLIGIGVIIEPLDHDARSGDVGGIKIYQKKSRGLTWIEGTVLNFLLESGGGETLPLSIPRWPSAFDEPSIGSSSDHRHLPSG